MGIATIATMNIEYIYSTKIIKSNLRRYAIIILPNTASKSSPKMLKSRLFIIRLYIIIFFVYE